MEKKEKRNIYNVTFNKKKATSIQTDLEVIENAIIDYVIHYVKGYHDNQRDQGFGAEHIKLHLEPEAIGQITLEELLNLGNSIREYLKVFTDPFVDKSGAKIFEWENNENIRFRVVADTKKSDKSPCDNCTATQTLTNQGTYATSIANRIITFYSDRNLKEKMTFKNPKVTEYYANKDNQDNQNNIAKRKRK